MYEFYSIYNFYTISWCKHYFGVINVPPQLMNFPASVTYTCQEISPLLADRHPMHLDGGFWGKSAQEGCVLTFDKNLLFFSWSIIWHAYNANIMMIKIEFMFMLFYVIINQDPYQIHNVHFSNSSLTVWPAHYKLGHNRSA